jgi:hypothetical protein
LRSVGGPAGHTQKEEMPGCRLSGGAFSSTIGSRN